MSQVVTNSIAAFMCGIPTAWAFGKYLISVEKRWPVWAAFWDLLIITLSSVISLTLWFKAGSSPFVLLGYALGNALGTWTVIKLANKKGV
jgi:sorbitol-specific phosphotransferase system component IIC